MIVDELKKANIEALKAHNENARNILGVVLNKIKLAEISKRGSEQGLTEADVIAILQKASRELVEEKEGYIKVGNTDRASQIQGQMDVIDKFLPKMMSEDEIRQVIMSLEDKSIPAVMRYFKENYAGKCEMRTVQQILKSL